MSAIHAEKLSKRYGKTIALEALDLDVADGEVYGYLGPNGAGKTTTIRLLLGLHRPSSGRASQFGIDCWCRTGTMITRLWRGWTRGADADAYEQFLMTELFPAMRGIVGFRGADVLRRADGDEVAFVTLTRFDSLEAIRAFAGEDYDKPVLEPRARELLSRHDERALHFETASFGV